MFTGLTRQEQRAILVLVVIVVLGMGINQFRGRDSQGALVIDAETERVVVAPEEIPPMDGSASVATAVAPTERLVDLNTASITELMTLPSIGETRARAIIDYRTAQGGFEGIADVMNVSGIGEGIMGRIMPHVRFEAVAPDEATVTVAPPQESAEVAPPAPPPAVVSVVSTGSLVNVNTASSTELETLTGIGPVLAGRIIAERQAGGAFRSAMDLERVSGIGPTKVEALRAQVTF